MNTREERRLQARADDIERELRSRRSNSERQAEQAIRGDRRRIVDERDDVELAEPQLLGGGDAPRRTTSERQAAVVTRRLRRT